MNRSRLAGPAFAITAVLASGCFVQVSHVDDPAAAFREARAEARRHEGKPGPARHINVLVWDPADRELVRVSVPMWLAREIERHVDRNADRSEPGPDEGGEARAERAIERHLRLEDVAQAGLGTLVEVEEEDGEQVLIWLR